VGQLTERFACAGAEGVGNLSFRFGYEPRRPIFLVWWRQGSTPEIVVAQGTPSDPDPGRAAAEARIIELATELEASRRHIADLTAALESNREIGAAIGVVMATRGVDSEAAFDLLRQASQARHTKLRDVAREVVATRRLVAAPEVSPNGRVRGVPGPPPVSG
jgi:hypothetical protein